MVLVRVLSEPLLVSCIKTQPTNCFDPNNYPLVNSQFANLNMAIEIVDLPIKNGDFPMNNCDLPIKNGDVPSFFEGLPEGFYHVPSPEDMF